MSSGRSTDKDDTTRRQQIKVDGEPPSRRSRTSPSPSGSRPQWATDAKRSRQADRSAARDTDDSPMMVDGGLTDESSDDSEEDSDELEETVDDPDRRELSGSAVAETIDVSGKDLVYVLEVIQQPQRARACGFGDKDRRPLSPPPIIQLRIYDKQGNLISPFAIDFHRFILMVDLWNGDQTQQRSIVMHPGARQDQYALFTHTASRASSSSHPYDVPPSTFSRVPLRPTPPIGWQGAEWPMYGRPAHSPSGSYAALHGHGPPPPSSSSAPSWSPVTRNDPVPRNHPSASPRATSYGVPPQDAWEGPSRYGLSPHDAPHHPSRTPSSTYDSRGWTPESHTMGEYHEQSSSYRPATSGSAEGWQRESPYMGARDARPHTSGYDWDRPSHRPWSGDSRSRSSHGPLFTHIPAVSPISSQGSLPGMNTSPGMSTTPLYPDSYSDRLSSTSHYSRVLVGSMGAVCQRLKGLDGQPGMFFFAHDLGIRTEGTFSLRFSLVDISTLCLPSVVKDQSTNILARVFSEQFTVYSAKRFPGVLPTTDLTQCFAAQSVRLPTRQKRSSGTSASGSRRKK